MQAGNNHGRVSVLRMITYEVVGARLVSLHPCIECAVCALNFQMTVMRSRVSEYERGRKSGLFLVNYLPEMFPKEWPGAARRPEPFKRIFTNKINGTKMRIATN